MVIESTGRVTVYVHITRRDERTLFKLKRLAMAHGGYPLSLSPQRHSSDLQKSGTCTFQFNNRAGADKFKSDLAAQISYSRARITEY